MGITNPAIKKAVRARTTRNTTSPSLFAVKGRPKADGPRESRPERWCLPSVSWSTLAPHVPKSSCPPAHQGVDTPFLGGQRCAISYPLFVPDTFSCKIRKAEGEEDRLGVDALSKTGSLTCEEQEASPSEPELKSKGRAVNAAH